MLVGSYAAVELKHGADEVFCYQARSLKKGCEFIWATNLAFAVIYICSLNKQLF